MICDKNLCRTAVVALHCSCAFCGIAASDSQRQVNRPDEFYTVTVLTNSACGTLVKHAFCVNVFYRRGSMGFGGVGLFRFGEKVSESDTEICQGEANTPSGSMRKRVMPSDEYRNFHDMTMYFTEKGMRLYRIKMEKSLKLKTTAKGRMAEIHAIIEDIRNGFGLELTRKESRDGLVFYECNDDQFEIRLEMCTEQDGERRLTLSVLNTRVRDGKTDNLNPRPPIFDPTCDVDISI